MTIIITAFERSPDGGKGLARDTRVRWALEEVGQPYEAQERPRLSREVQNCGLHHTWRPLRLDSLTATAESGRGLATKTVGRADAVTPSRISFCKLVINLNAPSGATRGPCIVKEHPSWDGAARPDSAW
jgi:hypothetical protein